MISSEKIREGGDLENETQREPLSQTIYDVADELRAIALLGLRYATGEYDRERYEWVLGLSARLISALERREAGDILAQFRDNLLHISPLAGAEAAVFRDGKLLLLRRHDDGLWALPGGLVEVGETLAEAAERELWEEVGVRGKATRLLGIFDSRRTQSRAKAQMYHAVFQVETDGTPVQSSEATQVGFFAEDAPPALSPGHHVRVPLIYKLAREGAAYFDRTHVS